MGNKFVLNKYVENPDEEKNIYFLNKINYLHKKQCILGLIFLGFLKTEILCYECSQKCLLKLANQLALVMIYLCNTSIIKKDKV